MAISSEEIQNKTFAVVAEGYDRPEVHSYLALIAEDLHAFNTDAKAQGDGEVLRAVGESAERTIDGKPRQVSPATDDFDRVGNEISLMLRQAQESAVKIRDDAEIEARALVEQVRLDIEADRAAHERAAGELISRTEERATTIRVSAEDYARERRDSSDKYAEDRRTSVETELADAIAEAESTRQLTAEQIESSNTQAEAVVADANERARGIVARAEAEAKDRSEQLMNQARASLQSLIEAEQRTRQGLTEARRSIDDVLSQRNIGELENDHYVDDDDDDHHEDKEAS